MTMNPFDLVNADGFLVLEFEPRLLQRNATVAGYLKYITDNGSAKFPVHISRSGPVGDDVNDIYSIHITTEGLR